jgi:hypothetical protein
MPNGDIIIMAAIAVGLVFGAKEAVHGVKFVAHETKQHVVKPVGCGAEKVFTLGHKHCKKPSK